MLKLNPINKKGQHFKHCMSVLNKQLPKILMVRKAAKAVLKNFTTPPKKFGCVSIRYLGSNQHKEFEIVGKVMSASGKFTFPQATDGHIVLFSPTYPYRA